jgi:hypothetical protein
MGDLRDAKGITGAAVTTGANSEALQQEPFDRVLLLEGGN